MAQVHRGAGGLAAVALLDAAVAADDIEKARKIYFEIAAADPRAEEDCVRSIGGQWKREVPEVRKAFEAARATRKAEALFISTAPPLARELSEVTQPASVGVGLLRRFGRTIGAKPEIADGAVADALQAAMAEVGAKTEGVGMGIKFHPTDLKEPVQPITADEKQLALNRLADLRETDPLAYAEQRKAIAAQLCTTVAAIDQAVKIVRDKRADDGEQSQATKLVAIGMSNDVRLWHSPTDESYASIRVGGHWENYRIGSRAFDQWLRSEYGRRNQVKLGDQWVEQVPGSGAARDAVAQLEGIARFKGGELQPAIRVGGDREVIWIDLGGEDWRAVRVTAEGWEVSRQAGVAFVRSGPMLALPDPTRGGSVEPLRRVLNVQPEEFVLAVGWLLQALNPVGPYPLIDVCGPSEAGKSTASRMLLRLIDPNSATLRRPSRKVEDLLIAARNGWTVGLDNLSWMTAEWSDTLCMLATGIASGTRAHYTNDEEHVYAVQKPVLFNGIPDDLTQRSDLASRTIKLQILPIAVRRGDADLAEEFERIWPGVFGALLDGLVGALRCWKAIVVKDPARLMDFERFAEAGCRAMGFREWEFVDAYAANRHGSMVASAEASAVGRAVVAFMKKHPDGFAGKMSDLYRKLETFKGTAGPRDWPRDATRLSTELSRVTKPLAAIGIECRLREDRRTEGGGQFDVVVVRRV